jgi:hypothetical protein
MVLGAWFWGILMVCMLFTSFGGGGIVCLGRPLQTEQIVCAKLIAIETSRALIAPLAVFVPNAVYLPVPVYLHVYDFP